MSLQTTDKEVVDVSSYVRVGYVRSTHQPAYITHDILYQPVRVHNILGDRNRMHSAIECIAVFPTLQWNTTIWFIYRHWVIVHVPTSSPTSTDVHLLLVVSSGVMKLTGSLTTSWTSSTRSVLIYKACRQLSALYEVVLVPGASDRSSHGGETWIFNLNASAMR